MLVRIQLRGNVRPDQQELIDMRYFIGIAVLYVLAGWFIVGFPRGGECTSEQRSNDPDACGIQVVIRDSLLWPWHVP